MPPTLLTARTTNSALIISATTSLIISAISSKDPPRHASQGDAGGGYNFAIVDEIDSILIDEARTPLIISAPSADSDQFYIMFSKIAEKMNEGKDFILDEKMKAISLTEDGIEKAEKVLGVGKYLHGKRDKICPSFGNGDKSQSLIP